jgi:hypothetical protein
LTGKNHQESTKISRKTLGNFLGIFIKIFGITGVQLSKGSVRNSKKYWKVTESARKGPNPKPELVLDDPTAL